MSTAPLWVPLVVAGLGLSGTVAGTIGGVLLTQRRSDRREATASERQVAREQAAWAREDSARTFEHRRQAYGDFYESLKEMARRAYGHGMGLNDETDERLAEGWQMDTFRLLQRLDLYASTDVRVLASVAYTAVWNWGHNAKFGQDDRLFYEDQDAVDEAEEELLRAIRKDLAVPDE